MFTQAQWYPGNSDQVAIGQDEVLVTPLQLANAYATFANGGNLLVPQLAIDAANPTTGQVVRTFPRQGRAHHQPPAGVAGGHAGGIPGRRQQPGRDGLRRLRRHPAGRHGHRRQDRHGPGQRAAPGHSVFTSFAPASNPRFVVDAFVEDAGYGASVAAPVVREIYDGLFNLPLQPVTYTGAGGGGQN